MYKKSEQKNENLEFKKNGSISLDSLTNQQSMNEHLINKISDISAKTTFGKFYNVLGPKSFNRTEPSFGGPLAIVPPSADNLADMLTASADSNGLPNLGFRIVVPDPRQLSRSNDCFNSH